MTPEERFVVLDFRSLSPEALRGLLEEFVTREGTDYGLREIDFDEKVRDVEAQLESGDAKVVFDLIEDRANIVPADELFSPH